MNLYSNIKNNLNESVKVLPIYRIGQDEYIKSFNPIRLDEVGITLEDIELYKRVDTSKEAPDKINYLLTAYMRWDGDTGTATPVTYNISDNEYEDEITPALNGVFDEDLDYEIFNAVDETIRNLALNISQSGKLNEAEESKEEIFTSFRPSRQTEGLLGRLWFNVNDKVDTIDLYLLDGEYKLIYGMYVPDYINEFVDSIGGYDKFLQEALNYVGEYMKETTQVKPHSDKLEEAEDEEDIILDKVRNIANELMQYFEKNSIYAELLDYSYNKPYGHILYEIAWGDWKHDHLYSKKLVEEFFGGSGSVAINSEVTEEDGSDTYSAKYDIIFDLDNYLKLNEAANPANEEKNKIIRDALKGPKSYNKNLKALQKMGINKNSKEMAEDDYGQTIYLHGPNGKHVSVDPDGTNVWRTFGTRDEDHYKKELDFKNRNSSNYNNQEHLDFNGKRAKDFDYYNYLNKPENKYQEEVDKANKVKSYRDNKDKTGYNLPDEALTPEEKSLNKRPRKYVQLSKDRKELEDELAGYDETKKQLDKVNRKIRNLHK